MEDRKPYPSDISPEQFEQVRPLLESVRKRTKPTTVDLHEVFNAMLYLLKSGCQWRMIPAEFPKWYTVYSYFAKWSKPDQEAGHGVAPQFLAGLANRFFLRPAPGRSLRPDRRRSTWRSTNAPCATWEIHREAYATGSRS